MKQLLSNHLVLVVCIGVCGCGGGGEGTNRDAVFPVSGKVMYKGQPVSGADVVFNCSEKSISAFGRTGSDGTFRLTTYVPNDGAVAGKHVITVMKIAEATATKVADVSSAAYQPPGVNQSTDPAPKNLIPAKYGDATQTDLIAVITEGENPAIVLELKD